MKLVVERRVKDYAKFFGIEFRQSAKPSEVGITGVDYLAKTYPAFWVNGTGVVWLKDTINGRLWTHQDVQFIVLHEVGHAIVGFFPKLKLSKKNHEIKANAIALVLCVHLGIMIRPKMIERLAKFSRRKRV